jgi:hypothetical protein
VACDLPCLLTKYIVYLVFFAGNGSFGTLQAAVATSFLGTRSMLCLPAWCICKLYVELTV